MTGNRPLDAAKRPPLPGTMAFHALFLALIVPPLATVILLGALGADAPLGSPLLAALPAAYLIGGPMAFLGGRIDRWLVRRRVSPPRRLAIAVGLAATAGLTILAPLLATGRVRGLVILLLPASLSLAAFAGLSTTMAIDAFATWRNRPSGTLPPAET